MKNDIHPPFYQAQVVCACGKEFTVGTTIKGPIRVETCYHCHPFYTGKQKLVDTAGRVDRFRQKTEAAKKIAEDRAQGISASSKVNAATASKKDASDGEHPGATPAKKPATATKVKNAASKKK